MQFVECLSSMAVVGNESSFYNYTKEWISLTDRGGHFHINNATYLFFKAVERETRLCLPHHLKSSPSTDNAIFKKIKDNEDVLFHWCMLCVDVQDCDAEDELLLAVIKLWVTIRGFSQTAEWMEQYKTATRHSSCKEKALRKSHPKKS